MKILWWLVERQRSFDTSSTVEVGRVPPCAPASVARFSNGAHGVTRPASLLNLLVTALGLICSMAPLVPDLALAGWVNPPAKKVPGVEHRTFRSRSMNCLVGCNIYFPPGY